MLWLEQTELNPDVLLALLESSEDRLKHGVGAVSDLIAVCNERPPRRHTTGDVRSTDNTRKRLRTDYLGLSVFLEECEHRADVDCRFVEQPTIVLVEFEINEMRESTL